LVQAAAKPDSPGMNYRYIYCHGLYSSPESFLTRIFEESLKSCSVCVAVPDLRAPTGSTAKMTLTDAIAAIGRADDLQKKQLEEEAEETAATATTATTSMENVQSPTTDAASDAGSLPTSGAPPLRLVGSSIGALAAAFYAEQNRGAVDRLFLMSPVFGLKERLELNVGGERGMREWQEKGEADMLGQTLGYQFYEDAAQYPTFPFVQCPTYVVHGHQDLLADYELALAFVRAASVNMRPKGMSSEPAEARRLLELDDTHTLDMSLPMVERKLLDYMDLVQNTLLDD